jgi:serine phosphatase RsbU (regulator of sigma subunit)
MEAGSLTYIPGMKVLIIGNGDGQLALLRTIFRGLGHEILGEASSMHAGTLPGVGDGTISGTLAPVMFAEHRPDLVVVDLDSRHGGGTATVEALRRMEDARWVPIWCLGSGGADHGTGGIEAEHAAALSCGADVYFTRPISIPLFKARLSQVVRYMTRQRQLANRSRELQYYFESSESEIKSARSIMGRLLRAEPDAELSGVFESWIAPAFKFSGDAVVAERSPDGSLKLLLADGVGHGLSAALNVLPVCRAFQSMAQKGFGLAAVVMELNQAIRRDLPSHRFVAATLVNVDAAAGIIEVWNGGNPSCMLMDTHGDVVDVWSSQHLPLGVVESSELDPRPEVRALRADCQLMMYSDGAIEAMNAEGDAFGEAALVRALAEAPPGVRLEALKFSIVEHLAGRAANDDVTLSLLDCAAEIKLSRSRRPEEAVIDQGTADETRAASGAWEVSVVVPAGALRELDLAPAMQEFAARIDPAWAAGEAAFTLLAERYSRALEQGLLKLDPAVRNQEGGPAVYAALRAEALAAMSSGVVRVTLSRAGAGQPLRVLMHETLLGAPLDAASPYAKVWAGAESSMLENAQRDDPIGGRLARAITMAGGDALDVKTVRIDHLRSH